MDVELKPTRRWPTEAAAALFESYDQGPAFASLVRGRWHPDGPVSYVELPKIGTYGPHPQHLMVGDWLVRHGGNQMFERLSDANYRERYEPPADELVPMDQLVNSLPDPVEFRRRLMVAARARYDAAVADQGDVHDAADTYQVLRDLTGTAEVVKQYASTFTALSRELAAFQRDQLERIPMRTETLVVPDAGGDITVQLDQYNVHTVDVAELSTAVSAVMVTPQLVDNIISLVEDADDTKDQRDFLECLLVQLAIGSQMAVVSLGKFEPQVTKVREFAKEQARTGADGLAAVIAGTIRTNRETRPGAKFTRKDPKP